MGDHRPFGDEVFCQAHSATVERHNIVDNDGACPWCGDEVTL